MPKLRHIAIAAEDPEAMAEFYKKAFDFEEVGRPNGVLADGVFLSDGTLNMAILKFKTDQLGKGMDYRGIHHFGVLVEDVDEFSKRLEKSRCPALHRPGPGRASGRLFRKEVLRPGGHPVRHRRARLGGRRAAAGRGQGSRRVDRRLFPLLVEPAHRRYLVVPAKAGIQSLLPCSGPGAGSGLNRGRESQSAGPGPPLEPVLGPAKGRNRGRGRRIISANDKQGDGYAQAASHRDRCQRP